MKQMNLVENSFDADKVSKFVCKIAFVIFMIFVALMAGFGILFFNKLSAKDPKSNEVIEFVLESGWSQNKVASELEKQGIIKSAWFLKLYLKINSRDSFLAGTYLLSPNMNAEVIISNLTNGRSLKNDTIEVKFIEGKRFIDYVKKISSEFDIPEEDILKYTSDKDNLKKFIDNYWFITDEILNEKLYYPLEGYIFADTYIFKKDASIEEIFTKMLDQMGAKLKIYEDDIKLSGYSVHSLLTMASMVELEAVSAEDRLTVAGVFYNRIKGGITLGSDVTTYYACRKNLGEKLKMSELQACNAYNTRGTCFKGLPVGPICSPSYSSITAAITPSETEYYYFIADVNNKLYFGITEKDHQKNYKFLVSQGLMP